VAVLVEIHSDGRRLSPWAVVVRIRRGLIVESRSYLSDEKLLDDLVFADGTGDADLIAPG
jgi:hypothetical protein